MNFIGKKLLFVTAHPDDESFLASGTILKNRAAGGQSFIMCATYGERGKTHMPHLTGVQLKKLRQRELEQVSKFLKVDKLMGLNMPDGGLKGKEGILEKKILSAAKKFLPDAIISFGPDGISGHTDHIAAGMAAKRAAKTFGIRFIAFAATPGFAKNFEAAKQRRLFGVYAKSVNHARHNAKVKIDGVKKLKALRLHKSQHQNGNPFRHLSARTQKEILSYEYFSV